MMQLWLKQVKGVLFHTRVHTNLKDFSKQTEFGVSAQVKMYVSNQKEDLALH